MLTLLQGDWIDQLRTLPDNSVHCCVTSPPYWGLRDYGVPGQLGLEKTPEEYVAKMVAGFREVRRVLREDGTCWVNLGDSYATSNPVGRRDCVEGGLREGRSQPEGSFSTNARKQSIKCLKQKDLVGIPWMVAFALRSDGWYLRSDIIWHKPNPMPESVIDRPTKSHEYIFLMSKSGEYFYDNDAVKEPASMDSGFAKQRMNGNAQKHKTSGYFKEAQSGNGLDSFVDRHTRNKRTVWTVPSAPYKEAHFATYPPDLIKPCILAGTSARGCCPKCGGPWERVMESSKSTPHQNNNYVTGSGRNDGNGGGSWTGGLSQTIGWQPTCECGEQATTPCTVLDPFGGSGTTGQVALELGRKAILIELNPEYVGLIERRTLVTPGLPLA